MTADPLRPYDGLASAYDGIDTIGGVPPSPPISPAIEQESSNGLEADDLSADELAAAELFDAVGLDLTGEDDDLSGVDELGDDELAGWFSRLRKKLKRRFKKIAHVVSDVASEARALTRNKYFEGALSVASIAFPPLAAGAAPLIAANHLASQVEKGVKTAVDAVKNAQHLASKGDTASARMLAALHVATRTRAAAKAIRRGHDPHAALSGKVTPRQSAVMTHGTIIGPRGGRVRFPWPR